MLQVGLFENCQLHAPESVVLAIEPHEQVQTVLRNCWVSGEAAFEIFANQRHAITIMDCTFACSQVLSVYSEEEETLGLLSIDARRSLFLCDESPIVVGEYAKDVDQQIKWIGNNNVYSGRLIPDHEGDLRNEQQGLSQFERWQQRVQETGSSYVANPFNIDIDELPELISNTNFRLSKLRKSETISAGAKHANEN